LQNEYSSTVHSPRKEFGVLKTAGGPEMRWKQYHHAGYKVVGGLGRPLRAMSSRWLPHHASAEAPQNRRGKGEGTHAGTSKIKGRNSVASAAFARPTNRLPNKRFKSLAPLAGTG
jgi:hypothetical protein